METPPHFTMDHAEIKAHTAYPDSHPGDLWVFGYGSLMWNPGFPFAERHPATAHGVHRSLCVWSTRYRGTPEQPGLVMGLLLGGSCRGMAFRVQEKDVQPTRDYLTQREQLNKVYHEVFRPVRLNDGRTVKALCYVVDQSHRQFAGRLPIEQQLGLIRDSAGSMGPNRDYVCNTAKALRTIGCRDRRLDWMARQLESDKS
ncbi:MAG: gamma-glutamylcyclotransferase [Beijerinckiaceae bacterium]